MASAVISQLTTMVCIMIMGIALYRKKLMTDANAKGLSVVLTRVAVPCNMVILMQREYDQSMFYDFLRLSLATIVILTIAVVIFFAVAKMRKMELSECGLFAAGGAYSNVIFMGQPLILAMYGADAVFYCVAVMFTSNVYLFTVCSVLFGLGGDVKKSIKQMCKDAFLNLICLSAVVGITLYLLEISLPPTLYAILDFTSCTTVCLSMIYIGSLLASADVKKVFKDKNVYIFGFLTLIVIPILAKVLASPFLEGVPLGVLVILMGTPAAAALPSFADMYGNDGRRASEYVFVTTVFSVITLPLVAEFLL